MSEYFLAEKKYGRKFGYRT